jgi:hypothetical protein
MFEPLLVILRLVKLSKLSSIQICSGFGGLTVSMLLSGTQVHGFKPGRSRRIFQVKEILNMPSFGGEVKPSVPCCRFTACKRSLNGVEKASFWLNYQTPFSPTLPHFAMRSARVVGDVKISGDKGGNV